MQMTLISQSEKPCDSHICDKFCVRAVPVCLTLLWGVFVLQFRLKNPGCDHLEGRGLRRRLRVGIGGGVRRGSRGCFRRSDLVAGSGRSGAEDDPEKHTNLPFVFLTIFPFFRSFMVWVMSIANYL